MTTTVRERGIMFTGENVRAILEDRKTQTRRVMNPQPPEGAKVWDTCDGYFKITRTSPHRRIRCPFGVPGDRLWLRETWQVYHQAGKNEWSVLTPTGKTDRDGKVFYRATMKEPDPEKHGRLVWRSAMLMPRWASRIVLEITKIRVQRIQEIGSRDIVAEGVSDAHPMVEGRKCSYEKLRGRWRTLWNSINAERGFGWDPNPWVWALTFRRIKP